MDTHFVGLGYIRNTATKFCQRSRFTDPLKDRRCLSAKHNESSVVVPLGSPPLLSAILSPCSTAQCRLTRARSVLPSKLATVRSSGNARVKSARHNTQSEAGFCNRFFRQSTSVRSAIYMSDGLLSVSRWSCLRR